MRVICLFVAALGVVAAGCESMTAGEVVEGVAGLVLVQSAENEYMENCRTQRKPSIVCQSELREARQQGEDLYDRESDAAARARAEELRKDLDVFRNKTPSPESHLEVVDGEQELPINLYHRDL